MDWKKLLSGDFMYDRVGKQIKELAKTIAFLILFLSLLGAIAVVVLALVKAEGLYFWNFLLSLLPAFLILLIGYMVAWLSGLMLYGFGELIDRAASIDDKLENGAKTPEASVSAKPKTAQLSPAKDIFASARNTTSNQVKRCPYCGDVVKLGRCEMCGKEVK